MNEAESIAYDYSLVRSTISAGLSTLIAIILIIIAIFSFEKKNNKTALIKATITNASCTPEGNENSCIITLAYTINGKNYQSNIHTRSKTNYTKGQTIDIEYDPNNPQDIQLKTIGSTTLAIILIVIAIVLLIIGWGYFYLVRKNRGFGEVSGAFGIGEMFIRR